jgi:hypothetical protein
VDISVTFFNDFQKVHFYNRTRNGCFSGGFGNGKTYSGCQRAAVLLLRFSNYRYAIVRKSYADLKRTTMQTFFKIMPKEAVLRHSEIDGVTELINGSKVYWLHSDKFDESTLRGLEINSVLVDQAEEIEESIYLVLDGRVSRWDKAEVPTPLLTAYLDANEVSWPTHPITKRYLVPSYMDILVNPEHRLHWVYKRYHPDSESRQNDHFFITAPTDPNAYDKETYAQMMSRDPEWVAKYVKGEWGVSEAQIHNLLSDSIIVDPPPDFIAKIIREGALYRILDHGDSAPTCCGWLACWRGLHIWYREYYLSNDVISNHRKNIFALSKSPDSKGRLVDEYYVGNYADPQIFKTTSQKFGGFWSVADEYLDSKLQSPTIAWQPADNNEFATRNRINELLRRHPDVKHPITGELNAPKIYFIKKTNEYPNGCQKMIYQIQAQKRKLLGTENGRNIFDDEREPSIEDHAYDVVRYGEAVHGNSYAEPKRKIPANSFLGAAQSIKRMRKLQELWN